MIAEGFPDERDWPELERLSHEAQWQQVVQYKSGDGRWHDTGYGLSDSLFLFGLNYELRWQNIDSGHWEYRLADTDKGEF